MYYNDFVQAYKKGEYEKALKTDLQVPDYYSLSIEIFNLYLRNM